MEAASYLVEIRVSDAFCTDRTDLGFWKLQEKEGVLHISKGVAHIFQLPQKEIQPIGKLMAPKMQEDLICAVQGQMEREPAFDISIELKLAHMTKWVRISGSKAADNLYEGVIEDLSEIKLWQLEHRKKAQKALEHKDILLEIANATSQDREVTLEQITALVAKSMNVGRVGIWKFNQQRTAIELDLLYKLDTDDYSQGGILEASDYPSYFKALETEFNIVADDALTHPHTCEFSESYLKPMGITSMMDVFIQVNGEFYGMICMEHVGNKRTWTEEEQEFAASVAALVSLNLERMQRSLTEKALSRSEQRYQGLFNSMVNIFFEVNKDGLIAEISPSCEKILGYKPSELVGQSFNKVLNIDIDRDQVIQHLIEYKEINNLVVAARHQDGRNIFLEINSKLVEIPGNPDLGAINIARDVTEMKLAEERIHKSLKDKELLLRELSHRTKNNLQVIQSMVSLKMSMTRNEAFKHIGKEIIGKIQTMALVHRKLYRAKSVSLVNVAEYVEELVDLIGVSYLIDRRRIKVEIAIPESLEMKIDTLTPFGLVLNELLTNSFKYAFPANSEGTIHITLSESKEGWVQATYYDDGAGFEEPFELNTSNGLGIPTIFNLVNDQMMGKIEQPEPKRAKYLLSFPLSVHSDRI